MKQLEENGASFEEIRAVADRNPVKSNYDDYVQCPHCGRKYAECKRFARIYCL
jgi:uncharacterized protein with PIN domain